MSTEPHEIPADEPAEADSERCGPQTRPGEYCDVDKALAQADSGGFSIEISRTLAAEVRELRQIRDHARRIIEAKNAEVAARGEAIERVLQLADEYDRGATATHRHIASRIREALAGARGGDGEA
jgi:hypothetical protein